VPTPVEIRKAPPLAALLPPADKTTDPPSPISPAPTFNVISPALPPVDFPVDSETLPEPPELLVPEAKSSAPLTPATPALLDAIIIPPLELELPTPEVTKIPPPVPKFESPA
jgi:hypothetical protein